MGLLAIELIQGALLPARTAVFSDIVSNTLGGVAGAVIGLGLRSAFSGRSRP